jgi:non-lysosomal glucosylceramidase
VAERPLGGGGLPFHAWRRPLGLPYEAAGRPRVTDGAPLIDDGPWGGVPLGGLGAGSIGRTHRGDFARWHLEPGQHRFETIAASQFSVSVGGATVERSSHVLSTIRPGPDTLPDWNWDWPVGSGTYHALFPNAWFEYDWDALPVRLIQRQFSPIIPENYRESSYPVAIFEWRLDNIGPDPIEVGLMFTWQNVIGRAQGCDRSGGHRHQAIHRDGAAGVVMVGPDEAASEAWNGSFAVLAPESDGVEVSSRESFDVDDAAGLWADFAEDGRLDHEAGSGGSDGRDDRGDRATGGSESRAGSASRPGQAIGAAVAATVELAPGESRVLPFVLAWDLPLVEFDGGTRWHRRYTHYVGRDGRNAWSIAAEGLARRGEWSQAIDAWQAPVLAAKDRPDWFKAALFNELYYLVDGGTVWTDGPPTARGEPVADAHTTDGPGGGRARHQDDVGRFAILECLDYRFYNTVDVNFYASWALLMLWPRLERAVIGDLVDTIQVEDPELVTLEASGRSAARKIAGAAPHDVGGPGDDPFLRPNHYRYQDSNIWKDLNSKFVLHVWRDVVVLNDQALAMTAWPAVVEALDYLGRFDRDGDGLPEHDGVPDQTFDTWEMRGPSAYSGALWLAALRAGVEIGRLARDPATSARLRDTVAKASTAFESKLWTGRHYRFDTSDGPSGTSIMAGQLAGQWYADATGLGDLVTPERVTTTLRTIFESNVMGFAGGAMGAVNGIRADGSIDDSSLQSAEVWVGVTYALAACMFARGLVDEAWQTAWGAQDVTYQRGFWFRTPEAYDVDGNFRASLYLRPLAIWALEFAIRQRSAAVGGER